MEYDAEGKSVYHSQIGKMGAKSKHTRSFALNPELAKKAAQKSAEVRRKKADLAKKQKKS